MATGEVKRTLEQMNDAQKKTIIELTQKVKDMEIWERFVGYMIENCEGQVVSEENFQSWMSNMLK
jgi:hypothetical protein